jgi:polar amino acid transport system substrate-binding protein
MIKRRAWLAGTAASLFATSAGAGEPLEILSADVRPLSIAEGPRRGIVLDVIAVAMKKIDRAPHFTFLTFAEALQQTQTQAGTLIAPLARSPQREASFEWIAKVVDVPQAMGTSRGRPPVDLAGGRALQRVGVVSGGVQESYLRSQGFTNLQGIATAREAALALSEKRIDAWYATTTEIVMQFEAIGKTGDVQLGPALQLAPVWFAGNKDVSVIPVEPIRAAIVEMERSGEIERIFRSYVRG